MFKKWKTENYQVVYGVRKRKGNFFKLLLYSIYHRLFRLFSNLNNSNDLADFCLIDKKLKTI